MTGSVRVVAVVAWLAVAGCSGSSTPLTSGPESTSGIGISAATTPEATDTEPPRTIASAAGTEPADTTEVSPSGSIAFGPGDIELPDPAVGLESLASFQETLTMTFSGTRGGVAEEWSQAESLVWIGEPRATQFSTERTGAGATKRTHVEVGGVVYDYEGDGGCRAETAPPPSDGAVATTRVRPHELLPGFLGGEPVGPETIGAIPTTHVRFDQRALGSLDPAAVTGDVWIADTGGFVVRYSLVVDGAAAYLGQEVAGTLTLHYEMQPLDAAPPIAPPAGCPPGLVDVRPPPDASSVVDRPGLLSYTTAGAIADVSAELQADLTAAGWVAAVEPFTTPDASLLAYERAGQRLDISVAAVESGSTVTIILTV